MYDQDIKVWNVSGQTDKQTNKNLKKQHQQENASEQGRKRILHLGHSGLLTTVENLVIMKILEFCSYFVKYKIF